MLRSKITDKLILKPLSTVWAFVYKTRRSLYEYGVLQKNYFKVPVISVGNLTFGGTGKTPTIIWLAETLEAMGLTPLILSRGYKGELENSSGIIKGGQRFLSSPKKFGDEPLLIGKKLKKGAIVVGKNRSENLKKYFHQVMPDVVLLDDGFQHIQLYRSFNIVLFDASMPIEKYQTAPLGYLREELASLKDADAILISRADQEPEEKINTLLNLISPYCRPHIPIAKMGYKAMGIYDGHDNLVYSMDQLKNKRVIAVTAIASPDSFYKLLQDHGAEIIDKMVFSDHYYFNSEDINEMVLKSIQMNAIIIVSEKDIVKIKRVAQDNKIFFVSIKVNFLNGEAELVQELKQIVNFQ